MAESQSPQIFRLGSLRGFLPLNESAVSTRGQTLSTLIRNRSVGNVKDLRDRFSSARSIDFGRHDDDSDLERDADERSEDLWATVGAPGKYDRRSSAMSVLSKEEILNNPQMRSMRLIGKSNPRYEWEQYFKSEEELKAMSKPIRKYYERNNHLITSYIYIDRLLDSSLPHNLIQEYNSPSTSHAPQIPSTISEESALPTAEANHPSCDASPSHTGNGDVAPVKVKRTPKAMYKLPEEDTPLLGKAAEDQARAKEIEQYFEEEDADSGSQVVTFAIYLNLAANTILLAGKIAVMVLTSSLSVLASLVDAALDMLSTAIVWTTTKLIANEDQYRYPVGRRRLEPIGVLVFSVIMITSFFQVMLECLQRLTGRDHAIVQLGAPSIAIMGSTVLLKLGCWFWCRLIKNSSVQALAQDAMTDVVFNIFSIIFPIVGAYASVWWLDALGGVVLSLYVIVNWALTSSTHIKHLTGAAADADDRNVLLYLTMRFARTIKGIQGCQAYHAGDKLNVEVDIVVDEAMTLRDSHDLGESLQYVLECVPTVDRAFVHLDYADWNLPSHMNQQTD